MKRRDRLSTRMAAQLKRCLGDKGSWTGGTENGVSIDGSPVSWLLMAQKAGPRLSLMETVTASDLSSRVVRFWLLAPAKDGTWFLETAEKNHEALDEEWINDELEEAIGRLEDPQIARSFLEVPKARILEPVLSTPIYGIWLRKFRSVSGFAFFLMAFFVLTAMSFLQYHRMTSLVGDISGAIGISSTRQIVAVKTLGDRLKILEGELEHLRDDVHRERTAFEFTRKNSAMSLRQRSDELSDSDYSRKRAYNYLADRIESSGSYSDIVYHLSRIPQDNAQAETIMTLDRANIIFLSAYQSTVAGLTYPVRQDGEKQAGSDFMISSGFGEIRPDALSSGGYFPHMAVDIVNVRNILTITEANSIVRFPGEPGSVVAAYGGEVLYTGYNSTYGWYLELSHPLQDEWITQYKGIKGLSTFYAHMAADSGWKSGEMISQNEKIGKIGDTGKATGPHLHFEVRVYRVGAEFSNRYGSFDRINPYILPH